MGHKVYYQYKEYKGCPEATEISKSRARSKSSVDSFLGFVLLGGIILVILEFGKSFWLGLLTLVGLIACFILYSRFSAKYDKETERMIDEVIQSYVSNNERHANLEEEKRKQAVEEQKKKAMYQSLISELEEKRKNGEVLLIDQFANMIENVDSMIDIWQIWQAFDFDDSYNEVRDYIYNAKEAERLYGRSNARTVEKKDGIRALLHLKDTDISEKNHPGETAANDAGEYKKGNMLGDTHTLSHTHT